MDMFTIHAMRESDCQKVREFNVLVHQGDDPALLDRLVFNNPNNQPEDFYLLEEDGQILAFGGLLPRHHRLGTATVPVGEIGVVGTHPEYRHRGLGRQLMQHLLKTASERGYALCFLYGIRDYYQQFGFAYAVPHHDFDYLQMDKGLLKRWQVHYQAELLSQSDLPAIAELYAENCRHTACSQVRSPDYWQHKISTTNFGPHRWYVFKQDGQLHGYSWVTEDPTSGRMLIREAAVADDAAAESIGAFLYAKIVDVERVQLVSARVPLGHPFGDYLFRHGARSACYNQIFPGTWAGMYRIIDLVAVCEALKEVFQERISRSRFWRLSQTYQLQTELGTVVLHLEDGKVQILAGNEESGQALPVPADILTQLVTGYQDALYHQERLEHLSPDQLELLQVLFPLGNPYIWDLEESEEL